MAATVVPEIGRLNGNYFRRIQIFLLTSESVKFVNELPNEGVCSLNNMSRGAFLRCTVARAPLLG
jgi:hypothetical protein